MNWLVLTAFAVGQAGGHTGPVAPGRAASVRPAELNGAGVEQRLGQPVPADAAFADHTGRAVRLGNYFGTRPVVLVMAYFRCPMLCSEVLNGLFESLRKTGLPPEQYEVVVVSFDARETATLAEAKRKHYLDQYGRPGLAERVHFLTGPQASIDAVTQAIGFGYGYDAKSDQFAHPGMVTLLTPAGTIARYFFGVGFAPRDLRLGLVEASDGRIGSISDAMVLFCLYYDPNGATYAASVLNLVRLLGAVTAVALLGGVVALRRYERKAQRLQAA